MNEQSTLYQILKLISKVPYSLKFLSQTFVVLSAASMSIFPVPAVLQIFQSCGSYGTDLSLSLTGLGQGAHPSSDYSDGVRIGLRSVRAEA